MEVGGRWHDPGEKAGSRCRSPQTLRSLAELVEEPNSLSALPCVKQTIEDRRIRERLRCIAWKRFPPIDFDNQMATFHLFCAKLDLNMDHHPSPHGSPIPKRSALPKVTK